MRLRVEATSSRISVPPVPSATLVHDQWFIEVQTIDELIDLGRRHSSDLIIRTDLKNGDSYLIVDDT